MADNNPQIPTDISKYTDNLQFVLQFLFSWIVILGISVIISGKLVARRWTLGFSPDDKFYINLYIFTIRARGDEVSLGFIIFVLVLGVIILIGGQDAYSIFRIRSGLDIGQWNSMCVISSFMTVFIAVVISLLFKSGGGGTPIISDEDRNTQIDKLKQN